MVFVKSPLFNGTLEVVLRKKVWERI